MTVKVPAAAVDPSADVMEMGPLVAASGTAFDMPHIDYAKPFRILARPSGAAEITIFGTFPMATEGHPDRSEYEHWTRHPHGTDADLFHRDSIKPLLDGGVLDLADDDSTIAAGVRAMMTPGHTPGVVTTEGITVYDAGKPYRAILWGGAGYRGGLAAAEESEKSADKVAEISGVQVNLQIHSWAEPNGYPGGGVLERGLRVKSRKAGDAHPFVDPATFTQWVKRAQENAAKAVEEEKQKAKK